MFSGVHFEPLPGGLASIRSKFLALYSTKYTATNSVSDNDNYCGKGAFWNGNIFFVDKCVYFSSIYSDKNKYLIFLPSFFRQLK
jgi:hypothetical protein